MTNRQNSPDGETRPAYTVLIVDDDAETLRYLGSLLVAHGYRVYSADNGRLAMDIAREVHPDALLLDIVMPGWNGVDTCRALKQDATTRAIPVIFLTGREDEVLEAFNAGAADYVVKPFDARVLLARLQAHAELGALSGGLEHALAAQGIRDLSPATAVIALSMYCDAHHRDRMFDAGARSYVLKSQAGTELMQAIRTVLRGETYLSPLLGDPVPPEPQRLAYQTLARLSAREREVLRMLAQCRRNRDIAESLGISVKTVETYRARVMAKCGLDNLVGLVRFAIRAGLVRAG